MQDGRTSLAALLEDEIFVDFFNIFLNLPVFGQRAFYLLGERTWLFQPELPSHLELSVGGLQRWLERERLPLFGRTDLSVEMSLCQAILAAPLEYITDPTEVTGERSLLRSCVGSARGMAQLRAQLRDTPGGEMLEFWAAVERLCRSEEAEGERGPRYHGLLRALVARHLQEPSCVLRSCVPAAGGTAPRDRARLLRAAQREALDRLRGYWVPRVLRHARRRHRGSLAPGRVDDGEAAVTPRTRGHDDGRSSATAAERPLLCVHHNHRGCNRGYYDNRPNAPKGPRDARPPAPTGGCHFSKEVWMSDAARGSERPGLKPGREGEHRRWPDPCPAATGRGRRGLLAEMGDWPHEAGALQSALACDRFAGGPLLAFLEALGGHGDPQRLRFWQEAEGFTRLATRDRRNDPSLHELLSQAAERVWGAALACGLPLTRGRVGVTSPPATPLDRAVATKDASESACPPSPPFATSPRRLLSSLLDPTPGAAVSPRLTDAQTRVGQELEAALAEFVDRDIALFVKTACFVPQTKVKGDPDTSEPHLPRGVTEAAEWRQRASAAEGLAWTFSSPESEAPSSGDWDEDPWHETGDTEQGAQPPKQGDCERRALSFEEAARTCPVLAVRMMSDSFLRNHSTWTADGEARKTGSVSRSRTQLARKLLPRVLRDGGRLLRRPLARPKSLREALRDPAHAPFLALLAQARGADAAPRFWREAERLRLARSVREVRARTAGIHARYFHKKLDPGTLLQCTAPIIGEIQTAQVVTPAMITTAQTHVYRVMEETWFKVYLASFPEKPSTSALPGTIPRKGVARVALRHLVRSVAGLLAALREPGARCALTAFLRAELRREKEASEKGDTGGIAARSAHPRAGGRHPPRGGRAPSRRAPSRPESRSAPATLTRTTTESEQLLARTVNDQRIVVNFLIDDVAFFQEVERFKALVDRSAEAAAAGMGTAMDAARLQEKAAIISRLFLDSGDLPACRVNVPHQPREQVLEAVSLGYVERGLFFPAVVYLLPSLIYYWRRFCSERVMRTYLGWNPWRGRGQREGDHDGQLHHGRSVIRSADFEFTTLRFSLSEGLQLLLPVTRGKSRVMNLEKVA